MRADVSTVNNEQCNFEADYETEINTWNMRGTGEISFFNCTITSAMQPDGTKLDSDPVLSRQVVNNMNQPYPKIVDLDVDYQQSTIYGMTLEVVGAFKGKVEPMIIVQDMWARSICPKKMTSHYFSSKGASVITNIKWNEMLDSPTLIALKSKSDEHNGGKLSISLTLFFTTTGSSPDKYKSENFTLAYVIGSIGVASDDESVPFIGSRLLSYENIEQQPDLPLSSNDSCFQYQTPDKNHAVWMYKAPFQIYSDRRLTVDFSNAISQDIYGSLRNLGELYLGIYDDEQKCVALIGGIPYLEPNWQSNGGIVDKILDEPQHNLLQHSKLVVVRFVAPDPQVTVLPEYQPQVTNSFSMSSCATGEGTGGLLLQLMLQETPKYIRPMNYYYGRLENGQELSIQLKVTVYGIPPNPPEEVQVFQDPDDKLPKCGIIPVGYTSENCSVPVVHKDMTDENGICKFTFRAKKLLPYRTYPTEVELCNVTVLPIDGQVYLFNYNATGTSVSDTNSIVASLTAVNKIAILAFSFIEVPDEPTWVDDIEPIFKQYEFLYPIMKTIVSLGNYADVIRPSNIKLIHYAMSLDINHPSYMPVTRDLSPTKRGMILKWLVQHRPPKYSHGGEIPKPIQPLCANPDFSDREIIKRYLRSYFLPERCLRCPVEDIPTDYYLRYLIKEMIERPVINDTESFKLTRYRPLLKETADLNSCTLANLKIQLQTAVQLEFSTIPPYLTAMYSIIDGCNREIHDKIQSVVIQEMLHMTQAANILIAIGGKPIIDSNEFVPSYPTSLPGGVLANLEVNLEKLSMEHVYKVFMGIEIPQKLDTDEWLGVSIGQFYEEIKSCINNLGDMIFSSSDISKQVLWPWNAPNVGSVVVVNDTTSANQAIEVIVEQGEGAGPLDPTQGNSTAPQKLAHFYKFEEIVCRKQLVIRKDGTYCYDGLPVPFDPLGVWPMQDNPSKDKIRPQTNCYTETKAFHEVFRALLKKLQEVFSGNPDAIKETIPIMESLAVHGQKVMWTKLAEDNDTTCGPVWDYDWDD